MSLTESRFAYADCFEVFDRAVDDSTGIRVAFPNIDAAIHMRMRMHQARKIDRADNARTYEDGHAMHGRSIYDKLTLRILQPDGKVYLYVQQIATPTEIESLSEINDEPRATPRPLVPSIPSGDRDSGEEQQSEEAGEPPVRSPQGFRRF